MKVLVTGSRSIEDTGFILDALRSSPFDPDVVIHGEGSTVDEMGNVWAVEQNADIETYPVPDWVWEQFGKQAGPQRNSYMVEQADACVAVWDGESSGTQDTFQKAEGKGIPVHKVVVEVDDDGEVAEEKLVKTTDGDQMLLDEFVDSETQQSGRRNKSESSEFAHE